MPTPDMAALESLPNKVASWSYLRPSPTFEDVRTLIAITRRPLVERYGVLWQAPRASSGKVVYLTFDEGYEYKDNTTRILDVLEAKGVPAAFFVTGTYIRDNPAVTRRMVEKGFLVGNHTWSHPSLPERIDALGFATMEEELGSTEAAFLAATGKPLDKFFRPPEGHYSERMLAMAQVLGYRTVFWSFAYRDWVTSDQPTRQQAMDTLLGELHDGSVLLLHAVSATNTENLGDMIDAIAARGYVFGRLDEVP
jgi:delta-lactam-biosynthetic de-N-acetylase